MSGTFPMAKDLLRAARLRAWLDSAAIGAPAVLAAAALGWRAMGGLGLALAAAFAVLLAGLMAWRRAARQDGRLLAARLDARSAALEDSAQLLFQKAGALEGLAALQRQRLEARLARGLCVDPRPYWSGHAIAASWLAGLVCVALVLGLWPLPAGAFNSAARQEAAISTPVQITAQRLLIAPPVYTGLPRRAQSQADAKFPSGARLEWTIQYSARPASARLVFSDGAEVPLRRDGDRWIGGRVIDRSALYRIEVAGAPPPPWHRLEVIADAPPLVTVIAPEERLTIAVLGQTTWKPIFEAIDDYGLAPIARLRVTLASGEGEQIAVLSREMDAQSIGSGRRRRWAVPLELAREGLAPGGDLIVQVIVRDNRQPIAQVVEGPSVILRQPSDAALAEGLDGLLIGNVPAFFRSQRQIIIDAEALVKQRRTLAREAFAQRASALASDQAALRFRYGQFLGEKAEGAAAPPTSDAPATDTPEHVSGDGHDHDEDAKQEPGALDTPQSAARQFGHVHDDGDAATLFDPGTRALLARVLDAMWGSERELRQARPEAALPFANQALEALKKAQGASRIYLRRTGSRLAPLDLSRRLSGKRAGIDPALPSVPSPLASQAEAFAAWGALEPRPGAPPLRLDALEAWALVNAEARADPLALTAAIAAVRRDPACADCRQALREALWAALQATPTARRRAGPDPSGAQYLKALE